MTKNQKIISVIAVISVGAIAFFAFSKGNVPKPANINLALERKTQEVQQQEVQKENQQPPREINVKAFQFGYEPSIIKATRGEKIKININNADVLHGIRIPDLGISGNEVLEFTADQAGEFTWYCANACGQGHGTMQGKLIVREVTSQ